MREKMIVDEVEAWLTSGYGGPEPAPLPTKLLGILLGNGDELTRTSPD
jgi:hypothetical protein